MSDLVNEGVFRTKDVPDRVSSRNGKTYIEHGHKGHIRPAAAFAVGAGLYAANKIRKKLNDYDRPNVMTRNQYESMTQDDSVNEGVLSTGGRKEKTKIKGNEIHHWSSQPSHTRPLVAAAAGAYVAHKGFQAYKAYKAHKQAKYNPYEINNENFDAMDDFMLEEVSIEELADAVNESTPIHPQQAYYQGVKHGFNHGSKYGHSQGMKKGGLIGAGAGVAVGALGAAAYNHFKNRNKDKNNQNSDNHTNNTHFQRTPLHHQYYPYSSDNY